MNTPNKLTVARIIATPVFMATMLINFPYHYLVSLVLFIAASLTDMLDGKIARKNHLVTSFGKFLDPLADKMLTTAAFLGFLSIYSFENFSLYGWQITAIVFIVMFREFMIASLRLVTVSSGGEVVAANMWGKAKTVSQMLGLVFALFCYTLTADFGITAIKGICDIIIMVIFWISAVLCIISGVIYLNHCKGYINSSK